MLWKNKEILHMTAEKFRCVCRRERHKPGLVPAWEKIRYYILPDELF